MRFVNDSLLHQSEFWVKANAGNRQWWRYLWKPTKLLVEAIWCHHNNLFIISMGAATALRKSVRPYFPSCQSLGRAPSQNLKSSIGSMYRSLSLIEPSQNRSRDRLYRRRLALVPAAVRCRYHANRDESEIMPRPNRVDFIWRTSKRSAEAPRSLSHVQLPFNISLFMNKNAWMFS